MKLEALRELCAESMSWARRAARHPLSLTQRHTPEARGSTSSGALGRQAGQPRPGPDAAETLPSGCAPALLPGSTQYAERVIDTVPECLLVVDGALRIRSANRTFCRTFDVTREEAENSTLAQIAAGKWNLPELREALELLEEGDALEGYRLEHEHPIRGSRIFVLNARRLEGFPLTLLALDDVTGPEAEIRAYQERLREMAFDAALAEERERRRIAVNLHDRIGQSLALAQIKLEASRSGLSGETRAAVDSALELVRESITDTRTLTFDLSPPILYDLGLKEALAWLAEDVGKRYGLEVELVADDDTLLPLDDTTAALVFRAVRELLTNVFKHAKSPSATVSLRCADGTLGIEVQDGGVGFHATRAGSAEPQGFGLLSVREQIGRLGGLVAVASEPSQGTRVTVEVPLRNTREVFGAEPERGAP